MKIAFAICLMLATAMPALADTQGHQPAPIVSSSPKPIPLVIKPSPKPPTVRVAEAAAPPAWSQDLMVSAQAIPVIGPVVSKLLVYIGVISSILTMLAAFLISALNTLAVAFNLAGLSRIVDLISAFQNGRLMYYLKFFSMFNARKREPEKAPAV